MSYRKIIYLCLILNVILLLLGYLFIFPENFGVCLKGDYSCIYPGANVIGEPLFFGLIPLIPILILLQFFRREVFVTWSKFATVLIPIIIIVIWNTPIYCQASLGLCFDKKGMTKFLSDSFAILSVIIIIVKSITLKRLTK